MAIDPDRALAARFEPVSYTWTRDEVIRYHLALGAGASCDGSELRYVFEQVLHVLGTFVAVPASAASALAAVGPGLGYDRNQVIHVQQDVELFAAIPVAATSWNQARVVGIYDTGRAALIDIAVETSVDGAPVLARTALRLLLPGAGGFGGDPRPEHPQEGCQGPPDEVFHILTLPQQAALYRMSGDRTPLHVDPETAQAAGFLRPTQPGLCTWGMVAKALVDRELAGRVADMKGLAARFAGPVYPGETLVVSVWRGDGEHCVSATVLERNAPALGAGRFRFGPS